MSGQRVDRKLSAVLAADVAGYSLPTAASCSGLGFTSPDS
jgi:hypothetical protein